MLLLSSILALVVAKTKRKFFQKNDSGIHGPLGLSDGQIAKLEPFADYYNERSINVKLKQQSGRNY